ncbi:hypothetical protein BD309DRAFT_262099 [Dichomitus squalens]|nr:hypothetical protein BD309DRAFT_262099 [Dichomitus squalens]
MVSLVVRGHGGHCVYVQEPHATHYSNRRAKERNEIEHVQLTIRMRMPGRGRGVRQCLVPSSLHIRDEHSAWKPQAPGSERSMQNFPLMSIDASGWGFGIRSRRERQRQPFPLMTPSFSGFLVTLQGSLYQLGRAVPMAIWLPRVLPRAPMEGKFSNFVRSRSLCEDLRGAADVGERFRLACEYPKTLVRDRSLGLCVACTHELHIRNYC